MHQTFDLIKNTLADFCTAMDMGLCEIHVQEESGRIRANIIPQENTSLHIGYRGQNINAMQQIFKSILWTKGIERELFILLDIDDYRQKNEDKLLQILADKIAKNKKSGETQIMPFLQPLDRRFIHLQVATLYPEYITQSQTDTHGKRVLHILKKTEQPELI